MDNSKHPYEILEVQYFQYSYDDISIKDSCLEVFQTVWDADLDYVHVQSPSGRFIYNSEHELLFMELYCFVPNFDDYFVEVN